MTKVIGFYLHGFLSSGNSSKGQWFKAQVKQQLNDPSSHQLDPKKAAETDAQFVEWLTPTYSIADVDNTVADIEYALQQAIGDCEVKNQIDGDYKLLLLGSSMGGFYAQYFAHKYNLPYVMINPALNPEKVFSEHLGVHTNPSTAEQVEITPFYIEQLLKYKISQPNKQLASLLFLDLDDEVIDVDFALKQYPKTIDVTGVATDIEEIKTLESLWQERELNIKQSIVFSGGDHSFVHTKQAWYFINAFLKDCC